MRHVAMFRTGTGNKLRFLAVAAIAVGNVFAANLTWTTGLANGGITDAASWRNVAPNSSSAFFTSGSAAMSLDQDFTATRFCHQIANTTIGFDLGGYTLTFTFQDKGTDSYCSAFKMNANNTVTLLSNGTLVTSNGGVDIAPVNHGTFSNNRFVVSGSGAAVRGTWLKLVGGVNNWLMVTNGASATFTYLHLGSDSGYSTFGNGVRFADAGTVWNMARPSGAETLFNSARSVSNRFEVIGATINGITDTFKLMNGTANVIRLENAVFGGTRLPLFSIEGGTSNRFELVGLDLSGYRGTQLAVSAGVGNTLRLEDSDFGAAVPPLLRAANGNRIEIVNQTLDYATAESPFQINGGLGGEIHISGMSRINGSELWRLFYANVYDSLIDLSGGASVMRTNKVSILTMDGNAACGGNVLRVADTGTVFGYDGYAYIGWYGDRNTLLVEDGGRMAAPITTSLTGNSGSMHVGYVKGVGNRIVLRTGGTLAVDALNVGVASIVSGVHYASQSNRLEVLEGGIAQIKGDINVGYKSGSPSTVSSNNAVVVTGGSLSAKNLNFAGAESTLSVTNCTITLSGNLNMATDDATGTNMHVCVGGNTSAVTVAGNVTFANGTDFALDWPVAGKVGPVFRANGNIAFKGTGAIRIDTSVPFVTGQAVILAEAGGTLMVDAAARAALVSELPDRCGVMLSKNRLTVKALAGTYLLVR